MKNELAALVVVVVLVLVAGAGYFIGVANSHTTTTATTFSNVVTSFRNSGVFLMKVNGSSYWADDVSKDIVVPNPGYSYFRNDSITFDGVKFQTICPPTYRECPGSNSFSTIVLAGAIRFNMTFPDRNTETTGDVIGDSIYTFVISQHSPRAGILIEYVNDYPHNSVNYGVFLLVSSCCAPPYLA